jgi:hypothetical protein
MQGKLCIFWAHNVATEEAQIYILSENIDLSLIRSLNQK